MKKELIDKIRAVGQEGWEGKTPYIETYLKWKKLGLTSYVVKVPKEEVTFYQKDDSFVVPGTKKLTISKTFDKAKIGTAITGSQKFELNFPQFVEAIAKGGCDHYVVDFAKDTITYYNADKSESLPIKLTIPGK